MTTITVTLDPPNPLTDSQTTYNAKSLAFTQALVVLAGQINAVSSEISGNAEAVVAKSQVATEQANIATEAATAATARNAEASASANAAATSAALAAASEGKAASVVQMVTAKADEAAASAGTAQSVAAAIAGGPVASVNGRTGIVEGIQDLLVSGENIKTICGEPILGAGNIDVSSAIKRSSRTANTMIGFGDKGALIDFTANSFTQTFASATLLGNGWWCFLRNSGTGDIALDPNDSDVIDGLPGYIMYPGETRLVQCDGTALRTIVVSPFRLSATTSRTFYAPPGYTLIGFTLIGAGAGGGGGGGGGSGDWRNTYGGAGGGGGGSGGQGAKALVIAERAVCTSVQLVVGSGGLGGSGGAGGSGGSYYGNGGQNGSDGTSGGSTSVTISGTTFTVTGGLFGTKGVAGGAAYGATVAGGSGPWPPC